MTTATLRPDMASSSTTEVTMNRPLTSCMDRLRPYLSYMPPNSTRPRALQMEINPTMVATDAAVWSALASHTTPLA